MERFRKDFRKLLKFKEILNPMKIAAFFVKLARDLRINDVCY